MPVDPHIGVWASLRRDIDAIRELWRSPFVAVPEDGRGVFSLAIQNLNAVSNRDSAVPAKAEELERVRFVAKPAAALLTR